MVAHYLHTGKDFMKIHVFVTLLTSIVSRGYQPHLENSTSTYKLPT